MTHVKTPLTHRQRQALETRDLIVGAARELFLERGYAATTIEAVAARAGVAGSTVYAAFKNKRGLLTALRESWHRASGAKDLYAEAENVLDPEGRMERFAHATRRQWETGTAFVAIYTGAAAADPEAAAELRAAQAGRRENVGRWLESAAPLLRQDVAFDELTAVYLALTRAEVYTELVEVWGWSADAYEAWLAGVLKEQLLPREPR